MQSSIGCGGTKPTRRTNKENPGADERVEVKIETIELEDSLELGSVPDPKHSDSSKKQDNSDLLPRIRLPRRVSTSAAGQGAMMEDLLHPRRLPVTSAAHTGVRVKTEDVSDIPLPVTPAPYLLRSQKKGPLDSQAPASSDAQAGMSVPTMGSVDSQPPVSSAVHTKRVTKEDSLSIPCPVHSAPYNLRVKIEGLSDPQLEVSVAAETGMPIQTTGSVDSQAPVSSAALAGVTVKPKRPLEAWLCATSAPHTGTQSVRHPQPQHPDSVSSYCEVLQSKPAKPSRLDTASREVVFLNEVRVVPSAAPPRIRPVKTESLLDPKTQLRRRSSASAGVQLTEGVLDSQRPGTSSAGPTPSGHCATLPCQMCDKFFFTMKTHRRHMKRVHNPETTKCPKCFMLCFSEAERMDHMRNHLDGTPYGCRCGAAFPTSWAIGIHLSSMCPLNELMPKKEKNHCLCTLCGRSFSKLIQLRTHLFACSPIPGTQEALGKTSRKMADSIGSEAAFQPPHNSSLGAQQEVRGKRNSRDAEDSLATRGVPDSKPSDTLASPAGQPSLKKSRLSVIGQEKTSASEGQSPHGAESGLPQGEKESLELSKDSIALSTSSAGRGELQRGSRVLCAPCNMSFYKHRFKRHNERFHNPNATKCPKCNKLCPSRENQIEHMRTHSNQKPYACLCHAAFNSMRRLCLHVKHECLRPCGHDSMDRWRWVCRLCGVGFSKPLRLRQHLRTCSSVPLT